jgi:DNA-binding response OmpR family regulator
MTVILVADDDPAMLATLDKGMRAAGFETRAASTGLEAVEAARDPAVRLVLLDVGLPDVDGVGALVMMRAARPDLPVLLVTGRDATGEVVRGLSSGADDYITKPFAFEELVARVRARLRIVGAAAPLVLHHGGVTLDLLARTATVNGREVELSGREFTLAEQFFRHPGQLFERAALLSVVWGYDTDPGSNVVDVYVGYLRRKLGEDVIQTVRGLGYRLGDGTD